MRKIIHLTSVAMAVNLMVLSIYADRYVPCPAVRGALQDIHRQIAPDELDEINLMDSTFELRFNGDRYKPVVLSMSNEWQNVLAHLDAYATSRVDRLLLINTGWWLGESIYLGYLSALSDMVMSNRLAACEFDAFECAAWNNPGVASAVYRRYDEPSVSNAIIRIMSFSQRTNHWGRIFSGAARERYERQVSSGLWN